MTMSYRPLLSATERSLIRLVVPRLALQARPYSRPSAPSAARWTRVRVAAPVPPLAGVPIGLTGVERRPADVQVCPVDAAGHELTQEQPAGRHSTIWLGRPVVEVDVRVVHGIRSHGYQDDAAACSRRYRTRPVTSSGTRRPMAPLEYTLTITLPCGSSTKPADWR